VARPAPIGDDDLRIVRWSLFGVAAVTLVAVLGVLASAALDEPSRSYRDVVVVDAPRGAIWSMLTEFDRYDEWNPYIVEASGAATTGSTVDLRLRSGGTTGDTESRSAEMLIVRPQRKLEWRTRVLAPGVLDREQIFRIVPEPSGRWVVMQDLKLEGVLAPFVDVDEEREGLAAMLEAIAEAAPSYQSSAP
jgi:hypothetical protein